MSDVTQQASSAQPLRRIVRPTPIARQRKMTIGRIASNSQMMANSFGRSTSIRRSMSHDTSVRFPTWLLPALPARADDLDPYRDRDIIALRQSRMKNRVVRQVQPRGLPMAANAHGRSRSGIQTGPSSIARRLHPIRRQPNRNEAHIGPTSAPLVRVASQPQRPTARPPRTRSTNSPTRNGNRTDRDGPTPLAPRYESVLVARSLLANPQRDQSFEIDPRETATNTHSHRLSLPRVSNRQSIDRSAVHRRPASTGRPLAMPSSRIPLSLMYEPVHRPHPKQSLEPSARAGRVKGPQSKSHLVSTPRSSASTPSSTTTQSATVKRQVSDSPISPTVGPNWTSFPSRDSSPDLVARKAESSPSVVRLPATSSTTASASTTSTSATASTTKPATLSTTSTPMPSDSPASLVSSTTISPQTPTVQESQRSPASSSSSINSVVIGNGIETTAPEQVRRRVRTVNIPRTPGWRQVVGLPSEQTSPTPPHVMTSTQDALFRRVAALANPSGTPIGTPGDIARRSPVSGSLFSLASSMTAAVRQNRESSVNQISSPRENERPLTRRAQRKRAETAQAQRTHTATADQATSHTPATQVDRKITQKSLEGQAITTSANRNTSSSANRNSGRSSTRNTSPTISRRSAKSSQSAIFRNATPGQSTSAPGLNLANRDHMASVASHSTQQPSFVNLWSAVNHSVSRQSNLAARRSLRLPQPKAHSLDSKPGSIVRQQFGLDNPPTNKSHRQVRRSMTHDLRSQNNNRTSLALRSTSQGNPSTARVMSVARQTRSHMSSITPGASGGIQFAGSLAKAISLRQTHSNVKQTVTPTRAQRLGATATASTTTSPSIHRSAVSTAATISTGAQRSPDRANGSTPLTGAGANVAQNFLDRLSRTTGEDFTPVSIPAQDLPVATTVADDVISRRTSRAVPAFDAVPTSASPTDQTSVPSQITSIDDQPHWAIMRRVTDDDGIIENGSLLTPRGSADSIGRASRAMSESASVANGVVMRSVVANSSRMPADSSSTQAKSSKRTSQRSTPPVASTTSPATPFTGTSTSTSPSLSTATFVPASTSATSATRSSTRRSIDAARSRQEIVERGGSISSRGTLLRLVSRSVPTQRLSSPLNDLPVSPNVRPGMRIPSEALSAMPTTPTVVSASPSVSSNSNVISRSVASKSSALLPSPSVRREGRRSLKIQRQASGVQFGPSEDGTISADALVRMIESGQSLPNQVVHRQVSGTSSSGLIRAQRSPGHIFRSGSSSIIQRSPSTSEKAAPGPVSILSQVLSPSDDSESGPNQITTSQLLDLMDWINRIVDDRLRQELERRGVAGGRW